MTKITKSIVSITLTTIMITSTMAIKANAANTNQELKWRNDLTIQHPHLMHITKHSAHM